MVTPSASPHRIRVVLADDHAIFRDGLKLLLALEPDFEVVADTSHLDPVKALVREHNAHLLLIDYHMPGGDSSALIGWLKARHPELKVVALTGSRSGVILQQLIDVQADAVLLKDESGAELIAHLRAVLAGRRIIPTDVRTLAQEAEMPLTRRELQITKLICDGLSNTVIADTLALSPKTVDKHRENILRKLEVSNVAQLVHKVHAAGWLNG